MRSKFFAIVLALAIPFSLAACGGAQDEAEPEQPSIQEAQPVSSENEDHTGQEETEISQYEDIQSLFSSIVPDSELKTSLKNGGRLHTKILTNLSSDAAPEGWEDILANFDTALAAAHESAPDYSASTVSAEIFSEDEVILASGFNGHIQFDKFELKSEKNQEGKVNPPTISKFEYDQISVGMTLSQVREIVGGDGTLENAVGTAGVTSTIQTYRFPGEKEGSYASILFDDYEVYSKHEFLLD